MDGEVFEISCGHFANNPPGPKEYLEMSDERIEKRLLTEAEEQEALEQNAVVWDRQNPSFQRPIQDWKNKLDEAKSEGYVSERCDCGCSFLAFHHWTTCRDSTCPMSDGVSMLQRLEESIKEPPHAN